MTDHPPCDGCNGTAEPLDDSGRCATCVRLDAAVDAAEPGAVTTTAD